ncbi:hypothetical protein COM82_29715 [Bacillus thuringiensis]|uniref:hypothetical protein n=1 Tax=Bacillus thuringiensis TaxID=1428 RepID=UPI000BED1583|nr:hypothetical protein [Bacillus thuringiensis]PEB44186.1 hypothetical protein COM82_29715 [Bacillus thuringiensis]
MSWDLSLINETSNPKAFLRMYIHDKIKIYKNGGLRLTESWKLLNIELVEHNQEPLHMSTFKNTWYAK